MFKIHSFISAAPATGAMRLMKDKGGMWFTFAIPGNTGVALSVTHDKKIFCSKASRILIKDFADEENLLPLKWWAKLPPLSKLFVKERLLPFPYYLWIVGEVNGLPLAEVVERGP